MTVPTRAQTDCRWFCWALLVSVLCGCRAAEFTVSGHSSGAVMASNHFMAFSDRIKGHGHLESVCYGGGRRRTASPPKLAPPPAADGLAGLVAYTKAAAAAGLIAGLGNLSHTPIFLYGGSLDQFSKFEKGCAQYYSQFSSQVLFHGLVEGAQHGFIVDHNISNVSTPCSEPNRLYILNCGWDAAGAMLAHLYGPLTPRAPLVQQHIWAINQSLFFAPGQSTWQQTGMAETGFAYVPAGCLAPGMAQKCRIHVVYHGCGCTEDGGGPVGMAIVTYAGYNEWGESNDIIIIYPQLAIELGCWEGAGGTIPNQTEIEAQNYDSRLGRDFLIVNRMVDWVAAGGLGSD